MIVVDIEAAGLNHKKSAMTGIGAVDFTNPERQFYAEPRSWEGSRFDPESLAVCGFTQEECESMERKDLSEVMHEFYEWLEPIKERTLVGLNPSFDRDFTNISFGKSSISWGFSFRTIDLHTVTYVDYIKRGIEIPITNSRTGISMSEITNYVGIPKEPKPHNALTGAKVAAEALSRILYGKNLLPEFSEHPIPKMFLN